MNFNNKYYISDYEEGTILMIIAAANLKECRKIAKNNYDLKTITIQRIYKKTKEEYEHDKYIRNRNNRLAEELKTLISNSISEIHIK